MNQYGIEMRKAQVFAEKILILKKNSFLDDIPATRMRIDESSFIPDISSWFRLLGFRLNADDSHTALSLTRAVTQWMRSSSGNGNSSAFVLEKKNREIHVLYGAGNADLTGAFTSTLPECRLERINWIPEHYQYSGIIFGTVSSSSLTDIVSGSEALTGCYVSCIAVPLPDSEVQETLNEDRRLITYLENHKSFQRIYGNATRRVEEIPVTEIVQAINILKEEEDFIERNRGGGFVRTVVRFGARTQSEYRTLAALIQSSTEYTTEHQTGFEPVRCFNLQGVSDTWQRCLAVPAVTLEAADTPCQIHAVSLQDIPSAVSLCLPPVHSYEGYFINNSHVDENERDAFPVISPPVGNVISVGNIIESSYQATIPLDGLLCHTSIFGACNSGKTTTVKKILSEAYQKHGIPFVVIEAAKKEYASLLSLIPELKVYTPGLDGFALQFNPLQPEDGILIEKHVDAVVRSLSAVTGGEHPIPEAFDGLLKQTYQKFGWEYGMMAYTNPSRPFPTFKDVFSNVDEYIDEHAKYGPEVKLNLTAALKLRTETMHSGALGGLFSQTTGLMAKDFLGSPCVIELSDFSEQSVEFLMNMLMFRFQCYLSRLPEESRLRRLIVVEEAHNVFKKTLSDETGRARNNDVFEKMLAEIRSSGTGLILSDQRPSIMPDAVMANTALKIVHSMESSVDRDEISGPMDLTEFQKRKTREFKRGECIISIRQKHGVQHTMIQQISEGNGYPASCLVCTSRFRCRKNAVQNMLVGMDKSKVSLHVAKITANPYNVPLLERNITAMLMDLNVSAGKATKICLLGEILQRYGHISFQESRIIVTTYAHYLEGKRESVR